MDPTNRRRLGGHGSAHCWPLNLEKQIASRLSPKYTYCHHLEAKEPKQVYLTIVNTGLVRLPLSFQSLWQVTPA